MEAHIPSRRRFAALVLLLELIFVLLAWLMSWPVFDPFNLFMLGIFAFGLVLAGGLLLGLLVVLFRQGPSNDLVYSSSKFGRGTRFEFNDVGQKEEDREFNEYKAEEGLPGADPDKETAPASYPAVVSELFIGIVVSALSAVVLGIALSWLHR